MQAFYSTTNSSQSVVPTAETQSNCNMQNVIDKKKKCFLFFWGGLDMVVPTYNFNTWEAEAEGSLTDPRFVWASWGGGDAGRLEIDSGILSQ